MNQKLDGNPQIKNVGKFKSHAKEADFDFESSDMIHFVDWNERRHKIEAQNLLKKNCLIKK